MLSSTEVIRCLLVEDDQFKIDGVRAYLNDVFGPRVEIVECHALSTASSALSTSAFHLAIVDMSIHSHEPEAGAGSPVPLPSGGLEVLFEVAYSGKDTPCIVLTQYPDIPIEGEPVPVESAAQEIWEKFDIRVAGCVRYLESDSKWKYEISQILERL
jgi:ActR/RegA family two-component response regulator